MSLKYCAKCILPNSRPNLKFDDDGHNCNCATKDTKVAMNWEERKEKFKRLVADIKKIESSYNCIIPVSGGKDSTWQVIKAL